MSDDNHARMVQVDQAYLLRMERRIDDTHTLCMSIMDKLELIQDRLELFQNRLEFNEEAVAEVARGR